MKLYDFALAPNPRRVRMFLAEKGIAMPETVQVNTRKAGQFSPDFQKINPRGTVPALVLDDGTVLTESVSICRYYEELYPEPSLFGRDAKEKAVIDMWNRRMEIEGYAPAGDVVRNSLEMFEDRAIAGIPSGVPQIPELAVRGRASFARFIGRLDERLGESEFIAGSQLSIADQTAFITIEFARRGDLQVPDSASHVLRWQSQMAARPSASA
jgi:glutathione S-transferase